MPIPNIYNLSQWHWIADRANEGYSIAEIARFVGLSEKTVMNNLIRIKRHIPESERKPLNGMKADFNSLFYDGSGDVCPPGKAVIAVDKDGNETMYKTMSEAGRAIGANASRVSAAVRDGTKCCGYRFYLAKGKEGGC